MLDSLLAFGYNKATPLTRGNEGDLMAMPLLLRRSCLKPGRFLRLLLPLLLAALPAAAQYQVGGMPIALPAPPGYVDSANFGPELLKNYSAQAGEDVRFLAVFLCDEDAARLRKGEPLVFERYLAVRTASQLEALGVDESLFELIKQQTREEIGRVDELSANLESISAPRGILHESDAYFIASGVSEGQAEENGGAEPYREAATSANLRIKGKLLSLCVFDAYRSEEDLVRTQETAKEWLRQVLRVNALPAPDFAPGSAPEAEAVQPANTAASVTETPAPPAEADPLAAPAPYELPPLPVDDASGARATVFMTIVAFAVLLITAVFAALFLRFILLQRPLPWPAALAYALVVFSILTLLAVLTRVAVPYFLTRILAAFVCYMLLRAGARLHGPLYRNRRPPRPFPVPDASPFAEDEESQDPPVQNS